MPVIAAPMTLESYMHAQEVVNFAVTGVPCVIQIDAGKLLDALHQLMAGGRLTNDVTAAGIRTITIDTNPVVAVRKKMLDDMRDTCLQSINAVEQVAPGLILKV